MSDNTQDSSGTETAEAVAMADDAAAPAVDAPGPDDPDQGGAAADAVPAVDRSARRRGRRVGLVALLALAVVAVVVAVAGFAVIGRPLSAPEWLRDRIEAQVNRQLEAVRIGLGQVTLVVEEGWHPRVQLHDIKIDDADGRPLLTLADAEGTLALRPLLRGQLQPARIWLTGAQLVLRRDVTGEVELSFGDTGLTQREAASFVQLIEEADRALVTPALSALRQVSADGLTLRYEDARAQRAWTVDGGRIDMIRTGDDLALRGDFALLSGGSSAATVEMSYQSRIGSPAAGFGISFADVASEDIAAQSAALLWLDVLRAPISGALRGSTDETGQLGPLSATLQIGEGVLQPTDETKPIPFRSARSYFTYSPYSQSMQFDELSVDSAWGKLRAEGRVVMGAMKNGLPQEFTGQMRVTEISANPQDLYAEPIRLSDATADMRLRLDPFELALGQLTLRDGPRRLVLDGTLNARATGWDLSLSGRLNRLDPERLLQLWPESVVPRTRDWLDRNLLGGEMTNVQLGLKSEPDAKPDVYLGWEFRDLETVFMKSMPPIRGGRGHASLFRNTLTIIADAGRVQADQGGALDISGTVFSIPDVREKFAPAFTELKSRSTITAALSLLDREPFRFISKAGQTVTLADGIAEVNGRADFLLKKDLPAEEVRFEARAALSNVRSETLVPGRVLAAASLEAFADPTELRISGAGRLGQVPVEGVFVAPLGKERSGRSRIDGTVELSQRFVEEFRLGLPKGSVSGSTRGTLGIDLRRGERPAFTLSSDLAGLALRVPQIGWAIAEKTRGTLEVAGRLGDPVEVSRLALTAPGLRTTGRIDLGPGGRFIAARFDRLRAGNWLDAPVTLVGRGVGEAPEVVVSGGTVDLSKTEIGEGTGSGGTQGGGPMNVTLDLLKISEGISLTRFKGNFTTARGMDGRFSALVNGGAPVEGRVVPQNGRSAFEITSDRAGGVFKSAGLFPNARGGSLKLVLAPGKGKGVYEGQLTAKNVWLRNAPAMAALLNAISVVGLLEQLTGSGILFGEVDARFRLTPKQAIIARSSAVGASMGISMDGYYDLETGAMNMQGVVSPFYLVNAVGAVLTRKGEGLIGFNYTLRGTAENPRVSVNPLSLLTPGLFREIFRRPPPKLTQ
ncbi:AsmA family protein [Marimonas arenosa]|uniref:AsmA family protein n=1 Tax=Marimonas arenosa TaxID=1795305 RepID=A0AAE3W9E9_9RHOB|nr:AsmA-like C-terminal region-containing protein [Marimonas arenosa]MDQ2089041.1 AsmA family protein [Marimonas arenosa]